MRTHLSLAALILIAGIVAGWWIQRSPTTLSDPIDIRNSIAQGDAVTATFVATGNSHAPVLTITFIRGKGWVWQSPGLGTAAAPSSVVSTGSQTLMAVAPGCYLALPAMVAPPTPPIPGVSLARDLRSVPGLKHVGLKYSYQVGDAADGTTRVNEDLGHVAVTASYTAQVTVDGSAPVALAAMGLNNGTFTVRRATSQERKAAVDLLATARGSRVTTLTVETRIAPTEAEHLGSETSTATFVSPEDCPGSLVRAPSAGDTSSYQEASVNGVLGTPVRADKDAVTILNVLHIQEPIDAPADTLRSAVAAATPTDVVLRPGVVFALPFDGARGTPLLVSTVTACQATAWFPCGG